VLEGFFDADPSPQHFRDLFATSQCALTLILTVLFAFAARLLPQVEAFELKQTWAKLNGIKNGKERKECKIY
jgi:hypothetical protein